jgi:hypothetical protein
MSDFPDRGDEEKHSLAKENSNKHSLAKDNSQRK